MDSNQYYQVSIKKASGSKGGDKKPKDLMKEMKVPKPQIAYINTSNYTILILYHQETQMKIQQLIGGIRLSGIRPPFTSRTFNIRKVTYYYVMCEVMITQGFPKGKTFR